MSNAHQGKSWTKIAAYVNTISGGRNSHSAIAAEGYNRPDPGQKRWPNQNVGGASNHCDGWAYDWETRSALKMRSDPIHDYICWEFGLVRCVSKEQWHLSRSARPLDAFEKTLTEAIKEKLPELPED